MFIGGRKVPAISGKTYRTLNPATGEEIAEIALGDREDVDAAVMAAREAFPAWAARPQMERSAIVMKMAEVLRRHAEELARIEVIDHGTPVNVAAMLMNGGRFMSHEMPWGGFKQSGIGKENSMYGLEEYTQVKVFAVDFPEKPAGLF